MRPTVAFALSLISFAASAFAESLEPPDFRPVANEAAREADVRLVRLVADVRALRAKVSAMPVSIKRQTSSSELPPILRGESGGTRSPLCDCEPCDCIECNCGAAQARQPINLKRQVSQQPDRRQPAVVQPAIVQRPTVVQRPTYSRVYSQPLRARRATPTYRSPSYSGGFSSGGFSSGGFSGGGFSGGGGACVGGS